MILRVVPLAKLLPTAHFPFNEDLSRIPGRPSGLFAGKVLWTISLPLSTPGKGLTHDLKVSKYGSFANAKLKFHNINHVWYHRISNPNI